MDLGLTNKVVIVTGATANIGRAVALEFAAEGVQLVAVGRDREAGARLVADALERGAEAAEFVVADLLDPQAPAQILAAAEALGEVEVLVNGVGGNVDQGFFVDSDPDKWAGDMDLNFGTVLRMTRAVLPGMVARKRGSVINIGSTAGLVGDYMLPVYSAMKGAVHSFTTVLAKEVGQHGVRVNAVAPYATFAKDPSAFSRGSRFHPESGFFSSQAQELSDYDRSMRQRRPVVGRPFAVPEEISGLVVYLASERAGFVTGQVWSVDGGSLL
ncbi:SDR family NAD(P)-dependent oxidoreductase [Pseudomaricurvus sp. HS19]|uniref:SDR family NAD(P)-dependent oxidoreductase n=1 Tax=Pseudomaricurvus sp. HS19 TaxID=2692626 RepID=UPI0013711C16|nr:SDR family oxidoreductase [Pseudomaricurvus sp. HS19]MYM63352.1 SDR family NAD(P)-dependent oxidoreductase [Pseudomaricurvus sp. HS19]